MNNISNSKLSAVEEEVIPFEDDYEEQYKLYRSVVRSEGRNVNDGCKRSYLPMFKHPLPVSEHRMEHENILRKVLSCRLDFQAFAAITKGDAWTLEEVYMQGAPVDVQDKSGHYPIHLAVQTNSIDCVMVLLRIGVDVNVVSRHGYTPLFLAKANNLKHIESLLIENKAVMTILPAGDPPDATILDAIPETRTKDKKKISALEDLLNMPSKYDFY